MVQHTPTPSNAPEGLNSHEAAHYLGVSERHLRSLAAAGIVPSIRLGRRVVYPLAGLRAVLAGQAPDKAGA